MRRRGDAADNCPSASNPDQEDFELDGIGDHCDDSNEDVFTDHVELFVGTDPLDDCPDDLSDDAWPPDINGDGFVTVTADVINYVGRIGAKPGDPEWLQRLDLDMDGEITMEDVDLYDGRIGESCE